MIAKGHGGIIAPGIMIKTYPWCDQNAVILLYTKMLLVMGTHNYKIFSVFRWLCAVTIVFWPRTTGILVAQKCAFSYVAAEGLRVR